MLTGLKLFSLKCILQKRTLCISRTLLNWVLKVLKWNKPKDRVQRVDERNGVICQIIMFTSRVMAFKMSEMANFIYFLLITTKIWSQFGQYLCVHVEDLIEFWKKMVCLIDFGRNCSWDIVGRNIKKINKK